MFTSVVIPTRNAADRLLYTLFSLNLQYTPFDQFEVIVLDNASQDDTSDKVTAFPAHYSLHCQRFRRRLAMHRLLNAGISRAKGEIIVFLSGSMIVPREFVGTHQHVHAQEAKQVLMGLGERRIYSVYDPRFSPAQMEECSAWLEHYPQIKRPHSSACVVPLLEEKQIASGLPFHIGLPCPEADRRQAICDKFGTRLEGFRRPWVLFGTEHVSIPRAALIKAGGFKELPRRETERDMAKRLWKAGCQFRFAEKLTLLRQERPPVGGPGQRKSRNNRRAK
ncbi:glycosyltransferase family 2 protein [Brevibacillus thermoruber]|jgi:hypothetical protein|uniref:glycosyltransferase family 2 protein n=1 Tax=Brevibacillus thermoruber TaxID=33942 RepID=UPI000555C727|nr:glycosyltransferase family A protein [Brevibacillus thermoruber]